MTESTRGARFFARAALRQVTTVTACWDCGRTPTNSDGLVGIRKTAEGVVGYSGVTTCGRIWLCPVCNAKVMARRAVEIGAALTWATVEGLQVIWGSLTVRHNAASSLADLIAMQQDAWRSVVQSRAWSSSSASKQVPHVHGEHCDGDDGLLEYSAACDRKRDTVLLDGVDGRVGYIRASEITIGANGWHPHFHPIILFRGTAEEAQSFADDVVTEWLVGVHKAGGEAIREGGQQLRVLTGVEVYDELSGYVTKGTYDHARLALEAVWSQGKYGTGRISGTVSHWTLLADLAEEIVPEGSLAWARDRWTQLEEATHGHRMITWSRGLRSFAGLNEKQSSDEEEAAKVVGTRNDTVAVVTAQGWLDLADNPAALGEVLDVLEAGSVEDMIDVLDLWGIGWLSLEDMASTVLR